MAEQGSNKRNDGAPRAPSDLKRLRLLAALEEAQLKRIFDAIEILPVRGRMSLIYAQHLKDRAAFVWSGAFRIIALTPSGAPLTMGTVNAGDAFGLGFKVLGVMPREGLRIIGDTRGVLISTPAEILIDLAGENAAFRAALLRHYAVQAAIAMSRVYELATLDGRTRLQAELLRLANDDPQSGKWIIRPAPTHAALGAQIGATREAVTRNLSELQEEGLISFTRGEIKILKPDELKRLARAPTGHHLIDTPHRRED